MKQKVLVLGKGKKIDWDVFEKSLHRMFGINAVAYDKTGARKTSGDIEIANDICDLIKKHLRGASQICAAVQDFMMHEARLKKRYITEECAAGMYRIMVPVIKDDEIEGFVSACGRPFISSDRIYTHYIHNTIDEEEAKILKLLSTLDPINPRTIKNIIRYITSYS
jgi:ligand-binding sensor protein